MLRDILVTSDEEAERLVAGFRAIPNMQGRLKIVELAERMAREKCAAHMRDRTPAHLSR